jgi:formate hydrogenlyase subunit 3/multisubunit Na+/H+ antiporter MnhD subunit
MQTLLPLFVAIPMVSAFLIILMGNLVKEFHRYFAPLTLLALLLMSIYAFTNLSGEAIQYTVGGWGLEKGIPVGIFMVLDGFSVLMLCIINLIGFIALFYSLSYMSKYTAESKYYALFWSGTKRRSV